MRAVIEDVRTWLATALEQVATDDHHRDADRAEVLLGAGIDHAIAAHIQRFAGDGRAEVGDQRNVAGIGSITELDAVDGLVGGDVHVGGIGRQLPVGTRRQRAVAVGLAAGGDVDVDVDTGLLDRGLAPVATDHVVGTLARGGEMSGISACWVVAPPDRNSTA